MVPLMSLTCPRGICICPLSRFVEIQVEREPLQMAGTRPLAPRLASFVPMDSSCVGIVLTIIYDR